MMMNPDDWTPAVGWRMAAMQIPIRTIAATAVTWATLWLLQLLIDSLASEAGVEINRIGLGLILLFGGVTGVVAGQIVTSKLSDSTGLFGVPLLIAAGTAFVAALVALVCVVGTMNPRWHEIAFYHCGVTGIAAMVIATKGLILD